jgi:hypothetical protein
MGNFELAPCDVNEHSFLFDQTSWLIVPDLFVENSPSLMARAEIPVIPRLLGDRFHSLPAAQQRQSGSTVFWLVWFSFVAFPCVVLS